VQEGQNVLVKEVEKLSIASTLVQKGRGMDFTYIKISTGPGNDWKPSDLIIKIAPLLVNILTKLLNHEN